MKVLFGKVAASLSCVFVLSLIYLVIVAPSHGATKFDVRSGSKSETGSVTRIAAASKGRTVNLRDVEGLAAYVRKNYPGTEGREGQISATLIDLDEEGDGREEILLAVEAMCGSGGCHYEVLKRTGDGRLIALLGSTLCFDLRVGSGYTNGYRNLELDARVLNETSDEWDFRTFKVTFNGHHYE